MTNSDDLSDLVRFLQEEEQERELATAQGTHNAPGAPAPSPQRPKQQRLLIGVAIGVAALLVGGGAAWAAVAAFGGDPEAETLEARPTSTPSVTAAPTTPPAPEEEPVPEPVPAPQWSIDDPASLQVVVNKQRPLQPADWAPSDLVMPDVPNQNGQPLRAEAASALNTMYAEASAAGVPFIIASGFRDFNLQTSLFNNYSASDGVEAAETYSARPSFSEHQTGLAVDITECMGCGLSYEFGGTPHGIWAKENAHRFGFILRYNEGQQPVVGYVYEPWHFRYVGTEIASDMHAQGILNLEDYFGLPAAPNY